MIVVQIPDIEDTIYNSSYKYWTPEDTIYLQQHYHNTPTADIAKTLHRSIKSVKMKASYLGLYK